MEEKGTNYGRLLVAAEAITDDDNFWRQKLVHLGYPYDTPNPQEFYFVATGFVDKSDVIEAGLKLGGDSLKMLMTAKKIPLDTFIGDVNDRYLTIQPRNFPLLPEWVIDYINANISDKEDNSVSSIPLWLYARLYRMTPEARRAFVGKYVNPFLNGVLVHFRMALTPIEVPGWSNILRELTENPYIAQLRSMYPPAKDLSRLVSSEKDYELLINAYKKNRSKYIQAVVLVEYNREVANPEMTSQHLSYYIHKGFYAALKHPWLLNKDLLPSYRQRVLDIFRQAAIYYNKEDLLSQRLAA